MQTFLYIAHNQGVAKGLFIWVKVIPVNEKTFRLAKYFCSVHTENWEKRYRLSPLPGKVSGCDVALNMHQLNLKVTDTTESYPAKPESCVHMGHMGKTFILVTEISPVNKRDLGTLTGKRFGSYERSVTGILFSYQGEISPACKLVEKFSR